MKDFYLTNDGDLELFQEVDLEGKVSNSILDTDKDTLRNQIAMCRILSVTHDWFYDNVGADLEQIIGEAVTTNTLTTGRELILDSLTKNDFISSDDIRIESIITSPNSIGYNVYIKQMYNQNFFIMFEVTLDLIKGVKVLLRGDVNVSIK